MEINRKFWKFQNKQNKKANVEHFDFSVLEMLLNFKVTIEI